MGQLEDMRNVGESVPRDKLGENVSINLSCSPNKGNLFVQGQRLY